MQTVTELQTEICTSQKRTQKARGTALWEGIMERRRLKRQLELVDGWERQRPVYCTFCNAPIFLGLLQKATGEQVIFALDAKPYHPGEVRGPAWTLEEPAPVVRWHRTAEIAEATSYVSHSRVCGTDGRRDKLERTSSSRHPQSPS